MAAPPAHTLYCDETGSTGSRFLDADQPTFIEGGWFVGNHYRDAARAAIIQLEKEFGSHTTELKGGTLVKSSRGQALIRAVCETMGQMHGIPYVYAVEKRYAVCAAVVDTFFDSAYNPMIPMSDLWDPEKRQAEAQFFYETGGALIEQFAEAYRLKDGAAVKRNAEAWVKHLKTCGFEEQASKVAGVLPHVEQEIQTAGARNRPQGIPSGIDSLNFPIVVEVFQFVEQHCPYPCGIVHDHTATFEPIYSYFFKLFASAPPAILEMKDGRQMHYGFKNALSLSFADSKTEPLIRAADYALAGTRKFIQLAEEDNPIPVDLTQIAFGTLGSVLLQAYTLTHPSLESMPTLSGYMGSNRWIRQVFGRLETELKTAFGDSS